MTVEAAGLCGSVVTVRLQPGKPAEELSKESAVAGPEIADVGAGAADTRLQTADSPVLGGSSGEASDNAAVSQILEMGFTAEQAKNALAVANGNVETAIAFLLDGGHSSQ